MYIYALSALTYFTISTTDVQVALITFEWPAVLDWNLQSGETADYTTLVSNINSALSSATNIGEIDGGFQVALNEVLSPYSWTNSPDRDTAVNVVIACGDGGNPQPSLNQLQEMRQHAR